MDLLKAYVISVLAWGLEIPRERIYLHIKSRFLVIPVHASLANTIENQLLNYPLWFLVAI